MSLPNPPTARDLLAGKVVVVTAAAGTGIGSAVAERALQEGASVLLSDQHKRRLDETTERLRAEHGTAVASVPCDVTDADQVSALVEAAVETFGGIDVLMNNAGLGGTKSIVDMSDEEWNRVIDITLNGTFRCTRAVLRRMIEQGRGGTVVNNASVVGWRAQAGQAHYAAAKAGVMALTRCSAMDVAEHNIRVNAVAPSIAKHPFLAKVTSDEVLDTLERQEAFGRAAEPWEVANVMVLLASDYTTYLTGETISVSSQHP